MMHVFGFGAVLVGVARLFITAQACREPFAIPLYAGRRHVIGAMLFMMGVNLLITTMGCWVTLLDMRIGGGARG